MLIGMYSAHEALVVRSTDGKRDEFSGHCPDKKAQNKLENNLDSRQTKRAGNTPQEGTKYTTLSPCTAVHLTQHLDSVLSTARLT